MVSLKGKLLEQGFTDEQRRAEYDRNSYIKSEDFEGKEIQILFCNSFIQEDINAQI